MPGLHSIFKQRGVNSIQSPFAQAVLHNTQQVSVMQGLLTRKNTCFSSSGWVAFGKRSKKPAVRLTNISLQIAGALEDADLLCAADDNEEDEVVALLTHLVDLERQLNEWLLDFTKGMEEYCVPYKNVDLTAYPYFMERCGGLAHIFPKVYEFTSFLTATSHMYVWVGLFSVRQAIADVARLHPFPLLRPVDQDAILTAAVEETASNLCKSVPYLSQSERSFAGILASGAPLWSASGWYKRRQDVQRSVWCGVVRDFLQRDILTDGTYETSVNLQQPILTWWMLPDIFETRQKGSAARRGFDDRGLGSSDSAVLAEDVLPDGLS